MTPKVMMTTILTTAVDHRQRQWIHTCFQTDAPFLYVAVTAKQVEWITITASNKEPTVDVLRSCSWDRSLSTSSWRTPFWVFSTATYISRSVLDAFSVCRLWFSSFTFVASNTFFECHEQRWLIFIQKITEKLKQTAEKMREESSHSGPLRLAKCFLFYQEHITSEQKKIKQREISGPIH